MKQLDLWEQSPSSVGVSNSVDSPIVDRPDDLCREASHLDVRGMVRSSDPLTSYAAARRTIPRISQTKLRVMAALQDGGDMTDEEISRVTGIKENSASKRRGDLVVDGLVVFAGYTKKTSTGSDAKVWRLA